MVEAEVEVGVAEGEVGDVAEAHGDNQETSMLC